MKFYRYLENKIIFFEKAVNHNVEYFFDGKIIYPIFGNKFYTDLDEHKEISTGGIQPKIKDDESIQMISKKLSISVLIKKKSSVDSKEINLSNLKNKYIETENKVFHPLFISNNNIGYIDSDGNYISINPSEYELKRKQIYSYYIKISLFSKLKSSSMSSSGGEDLLETPEEPEPEETPETEEPKK
jgi:hypothetical protein